MGGRLLQFAAISGALALIWFAGVPLLRIHLALTEGFVR